MNNGTVTEPTDRTRQLGALRREIENSRRAALSAMAQADRAQETELHRALALVVSTLDDCYGGITDAHLSRSPQVELDCDAEAERLRKFADEHCENAAELAAEARGEC